MCVCVYTHIHFLKILEVHTYSMGLECAYIHIGLMNKYTELPYTTKHMWFMLSYVCWDIVYFHLFKYSTNKCAQTPYVRLFYA